MLVISMAIIFQLQALTRAILKEMPPLILMVQLITVPMVNLSIFKQEKMLLIPSPILLLMKTLLQLVSLEPQILG